jgi:hypothetical protein
LGSAHRSCTICGRTILAGERVHAYLSGGEGRDVCELCLARAESLGWRREGEDPERSGSAGHGGRGRLGGLLQRRPRRPGSPSGPSQAAPPTPVPRPAREVEADPAREPEADPAEPEEPAPEPRADPAAPGMGTRGPVADAAMPDPRERAVARFNSSEAGRTVAGLTRTLGRPWVSVGAAAGKPEEMRITVAWELTWYQWAVDLGDELSPVAELARGGEVEEIDAAARQWNASADEGGELLLGRPGGDRDRP